MPILDIHKTYNSTQNILTFVNKLKLWKDEFVSQLETFELAPRGSGEILKSGNLWIYLSQLWTEDFKIKNMIILFNLIGFSTFTISLFVWIYTRKCCRENNNWLKPLSSQMHCLCDRTEAGSPSPPPAQDQRRQSQYATSVSYTHLRAHET